MTREIKLCVAMGTVYLTDDYAPFVKSFIEKCIGRITVENYVCTPTFMTSINEAASELNYNDKVAIDIADTRFTEPVWKELRVAVERYCGILIIEDTEDTERGRFLEAFVTETTLMSTSLNGKLKEEDLPELPQNVKAIMSWANSLKTDVVYKTTKYQDHPEVTAFLYFMAPQVMFTAYNRTMFKYINEKFAAVMHTFQDYLYIIEKGDEYWDAHVDDSGHISVPNRLPMTVSEFLQQYIAIPAIDYASVIRGDYKQYIRAICTDLVTLISSNETTIGTYYKEALNGH